MSCPQKHSDGFVIIAVLCILALIAWATLESWTLIHSATRHEATIRRATINQGYEIFSALTQTGIDDQTKAPCPPNHTSDWKSCAIVRTGIDIRRAVIAGNDGGKDTFPLVDAETLYALYQKPCSGARTSEPAIVKTESGFLLSEGAIRSHSRCLVGSSIAINGGFEENLVAQTLVVTPACSIITTLGYAEISESLQIQKELLLIAAGDIHIHSLNNQGAEVRLTAVSLTGKIVIDAVAQNSGLKLFARKSLLFPGPIKQQDNGLYPPTYTGDIFGLQGPGW